MIRRATDDDAPAISRVFVSARDGMTYLPRIPERDRPQLGARFLGRDEIWVVEEHPRVVAFMGVNGPELTHLYVEPAAQGRGLGTKLLDHAKLLRPEGVVLWVFQKNVGARRFYERHGFRLVRLTEGAASMEHEPDAFYQWLPSTPERPGVERDTPGASEAVRSSGTDP